MIKCTHSGREKYARRAQGAALFSQTAIEYEFTLEIVKLKGWRENTEMKNSIPKAVV